MSGEYWQTYRSPMPKYRTTVVAADESIKRLKEAGLMVFSFPGIENQYRISMGYREADWFPNRCIWKSRDRKNSGKGVESLITYMMRKG